MPEENVEIVRALVEAYNLGDRDGWSSLVDPDVEWRPLVGPLLGTETLRGREEASRVFFEVAPEAFEGYHAIAEEIRPISDDELLLVARYEGQAAITAIPVGVRVASLYRLRGGRVVAVRDFETVEQALEAAALSD